MINIYHKEKKVDYNEVLKEKYKAKADDKMRFTKDNVLNLTDKWIENKTVSFQELQNQIKELDNTPEKVVVPKFVADYLEDCKKRNIKLVSALCPFKMGYGKEIELWFDNEDNNRLFALAWINGYEVEKEPFSWAVKGITDYFKYDGKIIVFKNEEEALEVANLIGINTEVEKMNNIDCQDCISIEELREETK